MVDYNVSLLSIEFQKSMASVLKKGLLDNILIYGCEGKDRCSSFTLDVNTLASFRSWKIPPKEERCRRKSKLCLSGLVVQAYMKPIQEINVCAEHAAYWILILGAFQSLGIPRIMARTTPYVKL